ncbi:MAG: N-acetylglucosamine-6-phosphate deacetylase [Terriglobales bacterium]
MLAFSAATLLAPHAALKHARMLVEHGRIVAVGPQSAVPIPAGVSLTDFGDEIVAAGYLDLHIHGSAGYDVMDSSLDALPAIECSLARHGVTSYLPTTVTASMDATLQTLDRLAGAIEEHEAARPEPLDNSRATHGSPSSQEVGSLAERAQPLGIHLEGPFISHVRRGVHPPENLLPPRVETFERFWQAARGRIRMMTIAPELEGALELIACAVARGVCISVGHSDADFTATERAVSAGARHATHTFNAMRPLGHRDPGILGAVLTDDRVTADLIADGIHLDPAIVKLVARAKGPERTVLITDAISATGMPNGRYRLGSMEVDVKDGRCETAGRLAGSVLTMDRAVRNLSSFAECDLASAIAAASRNPARVLDGNNKGALEVGADADFIVLDEEGNVLRTFIAGIERA